MLAEGVIAAAHHGHDDDHRQERDGEVHEAQEKFRGHEFEEEEQEQSEGAVVEQELLVDNIQTKTLGGAFLIPFFFYLFFFFHYYGNATTQPCALCFNYKGEERKVKSLFLLVLYILVDRLGHLGVVLEIFHVGHQVFVDGHLVHRAVEFVAQLYQ